MSVQAHIDRIRELSRRLGRPIRVMEVCGTHTMAAFRSGLRSLLPPEVSLISGPGCPVCVTPPAYVDTAVAIGRRPGVTVATFGDMVRVPGVKSSLERARGEGASVEVVYSPLDALKMAAKTPSTRFVFLGIGFETTAPTVAWTIREAFTHGISNFSVLCAHKTMPRAMEALLRAGDVKIDGFLCPGHVSVITGARIYEFICRDYGTPCVVAGFEGTDMAMAIEMIMKQLAGGRADVEIQYARSVGESGNAAALAIIDEVFEPSTAEWRGLGCIPGSGLSIRRRFAPHDAAVLFPDAVSLDSTDYSGCRCGDVLRGSCTPLECPLFRRVCTPATPVGACMVSGEGTCAAYYKYHNGLKRV